MFSVPDYFDRLGWAGPAPVDLPTLRELHRRHLMEIPFDNSLNFDRGIAIWGDVDPDMDVVFDEVVRDRRGGVCFELNGLFRTLLRRLGFTVDVVSAGVRQADGRYGPDLEHMFSTVTLDGSRWLVDVGYAGPSYLEPLRLSGEIQEQYGVRYRLVEEDGHQVLHRSTEEIADEVVYRSTLHPRSMREWDGPPKGLVDFARALTHAGTVVRSRAFDGGQRILIGRRLLSVDHGHQQVRVVVKADDLARTVAAMAAS